MLIRSPIPAPRPSPSSAWRCRCFLGFRNNAAYDRWWEARKLWGQLVADCRALARETALSSRRCARRETVQRLTLAFIHHHRAQLRGLPAPKAARDWYDADFSTAPHPPCAVLNRLNARSSPPSRPVRSTASASRPCPNAPAASPWHRRAANASPPRRCLMSIRFWCFARPTFIACWCRWPCWSLRAG